MQDIIDILNTCHEYSIDVDYKNENNIVATITALTSDLPNAHNEDDPYEDAEFYGDEFELSYDELMSFPVHKLIYEDIADDFIICQDKARIMNESIEQRSL